MPDAPAYAELAVTSNFTFLTGASHPEELVARAAELGHAAAAIADANTLAGVVRAHVAAREAGIPLAVGCRLVLSDPPGLAVLVYPTDRAAYGRLCRLLTLGKRRSPKGECRLTIDDLLEHQDGLLGVVMPPDGGGMTDEWSAAVARLGREGFDGDRLSLAICRRYGPDDAAEIRAIAHLAAGLRIPLVAVNDARYHIPQRRPLQDVLTCIRLGCTIEEAGLRLLANAERHLKPAAEMARLFAEFPGAVARAAQVALRAAAFGLDQLRYEYPEETVPPGRTPMEHLAALTWQGAAGRYPGGVPAKVRGLIEHELALIAELGYAPYFLTVHDIVVFARSRGILCQGRGAAANSAVCYCLGVTAVDPDRVSLLFERFVSRERDEPPDIDIDFEHERREEVIQYLYGKYGRDRAALTAEVICYRPRSAVREVGKAMGLSLDCVDRLAKNLDWWEGGEVGEGRLRELGMNPHDRTLRLVLKLARTLLGFPRHLSQHVGGFVLTRGPLCETVPIENAAMEGRTVIEWDKDDIDALGILKVDVLGLGMLTAIRKAMDLVSARAGRGGAAADQPARLELHTIPAEDPATYDMICRADTVGVFQIESRAQMSMLPRLKPRCYYDLVIEVAIVRPGPIQGNMVHPYLRRREKLERVTYPNEAVRAVLERTLGVPLFQEQAMQLAIVAAGFTPGEADGLRRAMAAWKRKGDLIFRYGRKLIDGMLARGYPLEFAERCFEQIKGFSEYGFPESHAASFALLVYVSAWLKRHHPAAFTCALLNSQPMGFYSPSQLVRDAREHGVEVRPVDVNRSAWDCTLEDGGGDAAAGPALRLGMRLVRGLAQEEAERIAAAVAARGPFGSIPALRRAAGVRAASLRRLAAADAFGSMGLTRQSALWAVRALTDEHLPLFDALPASESSGEDPAASLLPAIPEPAKVRHDYAALGLSLRGHPLSFLRDRLDALGAATAAEVRDAARSPAGRFVAAAGLVLIRQRPATAHGVVFMTIEDETGPLNLIVRPAVYRHCRRALRASTAVLVRGRVERRGDEVVHVLVRSARSLDPVMNGFAVASRDFH